METVISILVVVFLVLGVVLMSNDILRLIEHRRRENHIRRFMKKVAEEIEPEINELLEEFKEEMDSELAKRSKKTRKQK